MSKLILVLAIILQTPLSSVCQYQSTNQFDPVNCIKDDGWQIFYIEDAQKGIIHRPNENQANFPGGKDSLTAFIKRNLQWPPTIFCGQGTVYLEFIVDSSGMIINPKILHGVCDSYDNEALRIISIMPNWVLPKNQKQFEGDRKIILPIDFKFK